MFFPFQRQMISGLGLYDNRCVLAVIRQAFRSDGLMILMMMHRVTHVVQMAGGLVQSSPGVPLGGGRMDRGGLSPPRVSAVNGLK